MDSTFVHSRALFEFFTGQGSNYHSMDELGIPLLKSQWYTDHWKSALHDRIAHLQDRDSDPMLATASDDIKHLKNMPPDFAAEVRRLWKEMIVALQGSRLDALATQAEDLLGEADEAARLVRCSDRSGIY